MRTPEPHEECKAVHGPVLNDGESWSYAVHGPEDVYVIVSSAEAKNLEELDARLAMMDPDAARRAVVWLVDKYGGAGGE